MIVFLKALEIFLRVYIRRNFFMKWLKQSFPIETFYFSPIIFYFKLRTFENNFNLCERFI